MILAHQIALDPNKTQKAFFRQACGVSRYTWNWALDQANKHYAETGECVDFMELKKHWNQIKPEWVYETHRDANSQPFANLKSAFSQFFKGLKKGRKVGKPKFKKRGTNDKFYVANDKFRVDGDTVFLPKIGEVRMHEPLRFEGRILSGTVRLKAGRWFLSIQVDVGSDYRRDYRPKRQAVCRSGSRAQDRCRNLRESAVRGP